MPDNIALMHLPLHAPKLKPVENLWKQRRGNHLSTGVWDSYDVIAKE